MAPKKGDSQPKTGKGKATEQGSSDQPTNSAVQSAFNTAAHGLARAATSRPGSAASSPLSSVTSSRPGSAASSTSPKKLIAEVLEEKLPDFPSGTGSNFADKKFHAVTKASGKSTLTAKPPIGWDADDMELFYKTHFTDEIAKISAPYWVPQVENSFRMANEGDVVRASALYLVNSVNIAAQAWLDNKYKDKYFLKCVAEDTDTEILTTRTDLEWRLETPADAKRDSPQELRRVAIMEYKRKHLINPNELSIARCDPGTAHEELEKRAKSKDGEKSCFAGTALRLVKQIKGYQTNRNVTDVCLFDWDTIFILDFKGKDPHKGSTSGENDADTDEPWPAGMFYQEQASPQEAKAAAAEYTFRSLLFAFLIRALKRVLDPSTPNEPSGSNTHNEKPSTSSQGNTAETAGKKTRLPTRPKQAGEGTGEPQQGGKGKVQSGETSRMAGGVSTRSSTSGGGASGGTSGRGGGASTGSGGRGGASATGKGSGKK